MAAGLRQHSRICSRRAAGRTLTEMMPQATLGRWLPSPLDGMAAYLRAQRWRVNPCPLAPNCAAGPTHGIALQAGGQAGGQHRGWGPRECARRQAAASAAEPSCPLLHQLLAAVKDDVQPLGLRHLHLLCVEPPEGGGRAGGRAGARRACQGRCRHSCTGLAGRCCLRQPDSGGGAQLWAAPVVLPASMLHARLPAPAQAATGCAEWLAAGPAAGRAATGVATTVPASQPALPARLVSTASSSGRRRV